MRRLARLLPFRGLQYDAIVVGGGSGGVAAANELATRGKQVCCLDAVTPTPSGNTWSLGGTCVNVGCIPKKLMHVATLKDPTVWMDGFGYSSEAPIEHSWSVMQEHVIQHVRSLNFKIRVGLMQNGVDFFPHYGRFTDSHTVVLDDPEETELIGDSIILATGLRPRYPDIEGAELCLTSDDLFLFADDPGRVLVIGAAFIGLESAGVLLHDAEDVAVMVRSEVLRGFDRQCAEFVKEDLLSFGAGKLRYLEPCVPLKVEESPDGTGRLVTYENLETREVSVEEFDTVVMAAGREPRLSNMDLPAAIDFAADGRVIVEESSMLTSVPNFYAIGDINTIGPQLTPIAALQGEIAARHILEEQIPEVNYDLVPKCVFTPLEYGLCGLTEEQAVTSLGEGRVRTFAQTVNLLEYSPTEMSGRQGLMKVICDAEDSERVIGFHAVVPNAGEVTQGVAIGMRLGMTKGDLDATVGIHPTYAEKMTSLREGVTEDDAC